MRRWREQHSIVEGANPVPIEYPPPENEYLFDAESETEMVRLQKQDRLMTEAMDGLFPERPESEELTGVHNLLDVGCGPAGWALSVAHAYPKVHVTGIDVSERMIRYARAMAKAQWLENNTEFRVMDATQPLAFPDNSFDLVNARLITAFMNAAQWPGLLRECCRILRPGGIMRLTEWDTATSTSPDYDQLGYMTYMLFWKAGKSFSPNGRSIAIAPRMRQLLETAGFEHIQKIAHIIESSPKVEGYSMWVENVQAVFQAFQPTLVKMGITTDEEFERIYRAAYPDMLSDDFCGVSYYVTMWGTKGEA
jgi:ubiquinone/menaquinone biosynthesis C-methylase UbiE